MTSFLDVVAPKPVVVVESLTDGTVDANVDLSCAVNLAAFTRRTHRLPLVRVDWLPEHMIDRCGRRRSPATIPANRRGVKPGNHGLTYRPSPLSDDEAFALLGVYGDSPTDVRDRAFTGLLWRSGLRISEALALTFDDLNADAGTITVRHGKNDKYGTVGMDAFGWELIDPWLEIRHRYPPGEGTVFCVILGVSRGQAMGATGYRTKLHKLAAKAGVTKRVHPHGLRHSLAVGLDREGLRLPLIQRQLRHSNPGITGRYLEGISNSEVIAAVGARVRPIAGVADFQPSIEEER